MRRLLLPLLILALSGSCLAATYDVSAVRITKDTAAISDTGNGSIAEIDITQDGTPHPTTGGLYSLGLGVNNSPASAKIVFTVTSPGYDNTGTLGTIQRTIWGVSNVRKPYPDNTSNDEVSTGGTLTIRVILSRYIYSGDTVTVAIGPGIYTEGGQTNNALAAGTSVTNNSTLAHVKAIGHFELPGLQRITTSDFLVEVTAFHNSGRNGQPLACVKITATGESSLASVTKTVTAMTVSTKPDPNKVLVYAATFTSSDWASFTQGEIVDINFKAYPWVGDAGSVLDSTVGVDGTAQPSALLGPMLCVLDKTGGYGISFAVVDPSGTHANAQVYSSQSAAETAYNGDHTTSYATIGLAAEAIKTYNTALNPSRAESGGGTILLIAATHEAYGKAGVDLGAMTSWLTVTHMSTVARADAIIGANTSTRQWNCKALRFYDITISGSTAITIYGVATTSVLWLDSCVINLATNPGIESFILAHATWNSVLSVGTSTGLNHTSTTKCPYGLVRGNVVPTSTTIIAQLYNFVGNQNLIPTSTYVTGNAQTSPVTTNSICAFNTVLNFNAATVLVNAFNTSPGNTPVNNFAVVQNVFENRVNTQPITQMAANTSQIDPSSNILLWHNTIAGSRSNNGYNLGPGITTTYNHINWSVIGNSFEAFCHHPDDGVALGSTANGGRHGGWNIEYMVGARSNNIHSNTVAVTFAGIYSVAGGSGVLGYVSDKSATGDATGNGDYHLTSSSTALGLVPAGMSVLPFDLDGKPRRNSGAGAAGAYEYGSDSSGGGGAPTLLGIGGF